MTGSVLQRGLPRAAVCLLALLAAACEHGPPAIEHGAVLAASPAHQAAENTGGGGIAGAVIGGTVGGLIGGRGAGAVLGAGIGIGAGGLAGSAAEGAAQPTDGVSYTVRIDDGRVVTVVQHLNPNEAIIPPGTRVRITTEGPIQRVIFDPT
jgi:outer membrane lipoprotein SlyB